MRLEVDACQGYPPTDTRLSSLSSGSVEASLEPQSLAVTKMKPSQSHLKRNARRQAISLPLMILVVGVAGSFSIWKYLRDSRLEVVTSDFKRDAWIIADQVCTQ